MLFPSPGFMNAKLFVWIFISGIICSCNASYKHVKDAAYFYQPGKDSLLSGDAGMEKVISPYKDSLDKTMNESLVISSGSLEKGQPESALGNMVADACLFVIREHASEKGIEQPDFCVLNNGGLRSSLPAGTITRKNVYELMPFENELVIISLQGTEVMELLEYISAKGGVPVSDLRMNLKSEQLNKSFIGGNEFNRSVTYRVLTSDYLANGGDAMTVFSKNIKTVATQIKVRDAIIEYLQYLQINNDTLHPLTDGRITK